MYKKLSTLAFFLIASFAFAQNGNLRGTVTDGDAAEPMFAANVVQKGSMNGTTTDFDGNYSLSMPAGTYAIEFSFIGYTTSTVTDVVIKAGETTTLNFTLMPSSATLGEVTITAEQAKDTEISMIILQRKSAKIQDGISSQSFRKSGDSDLGASIKRVTGVSIEGGKFVYVRGLGDRYTKTILNGMAIPGLDPDRNAVQMDIFPTTVLENVVVYKTFSPDLYGDFTGGIVDVQTKSFPVEKTTAFSLGLGYNPAMHFNDQFVSYEGGGTDFLGFDDGTRALGFDKTIVIPDEVLNDPKLEELTKSFSGIMTAKRATSFLNTSFSFNHGNQINKEKGTYGYNVVLNYRNSYEYFENISFGEYRKNEGDKSLNNLRPESVRRGDLGTNDVLWSTLVSGAFKNTNNSYALTLLHTQNGIRSTSDRINQNFEQNVSTLLEDILTYTERSISNATLIGKHSIGEEMTLNWTNSFSYSTINDPDFRKTALSIEGTDTLLRGGDGAQINRFFRDLTEINESVKVDFSMPYPNSEKSTLKAGAAYTYKTRNFEVLNYNFDITSDVKGNGVSGNPDDFFLDENIWDAQGQSGTYLLANAQEKANAFDAYQNTMAAYLMGELQLMLRLKAVLGARMEYNTMFYNGQNNLGTLVYNNEKTLDNVNILPSLNLVYALNEDQNLRFSFNKTLARPTFMEKSIAQIYDPISDRTRIGNIDLDQTNVDNIDLRWEYYLSPSEIISVSGFYKAFDGHIEWVSFEQAPDQLTPKNLGESMVLGAEFEVRKSLDFINSRMKGFVIGGNVSIVKSSVDTRTNIIFVDPLTNEETTEYDKRVEVARVGEVVDEFRPMAGQSPYLINGFFNYQGVENGVNANLSYNVQGESLSIVGSGNVPDVYVRPFHSLNFNIIKTFGEDNKYRITFSVQNILNDEKEQFYKSYQADEEIFSIFRPSRMFGLKFGMSL